ncbi:MAG: hypothetical protein IJK96_04935 [Bacteroidales bacterium]|nr:hypothetical protein [Bacteroidales bacterium]
MNVRTLWIMKMREAASVRPQRTFIATLRDAHQIAIVLYNLKVIKKFSLPNIIYLLKNNKIFPFFVGLNKEPRKKPGKLHFKNLFITLQSLSESATEGVSGEVGEWLKPAVC